jgi:predicted DCC family thiol-disulfide oxidoreductase YuxK
MQRYSSIFNGLTISDLNLCAMDKINTVTHPNVVLFDGVCNLCNASVDFILKWEHSDTLKFASLQSDFAQKLIKTSGMEVLPDSFIFYTDGKLYLQSDAVCQVARYLKSPWRWAALLRFIPRIIRNRLYAWVARNRYRWFGKKETCRLPTAEERAKFLG